MLQNLLLASYDFFDAYPIIGFLLFLFVLFTIIFGLNYFFNREFHKAFWLAEDRLKARLQSIEPMNLDLYLKQTKVPAEYYVNAKQLLKDLTIGLPINDPEKLTFKEALKYYFDIPVSQLPLNEKQLKYFPSGYIRIYHEHFFDVLVVFYGSENWYAIWRENKKMPQTEDDLIDFVLDMTPEEFLCFFVPLASESYNKINNNG